ncbi:MAG TPA: 30S ribosomal protein S8 [Nitrospiria bacterium]|nr:30S ribosomal protein S8 [Nitrospiria bacterium]
MSMTDPIADMLTRIRNAMMRRHESVLIPASRIKRDIAKLLKDEGFVRDARVVSQEGRQAIKIDLKYLNEDDSVIVGIERVSTPGRRVYVGQDSIPTVKGGYGVAILSTNKGILTDKQSRQAKVGGEVLCYVW